jgi:hypothetical protein
VTADLAVLEVHEASFLASWTLSSVEVDGRKVDIHRSMPDSMFTGVPVEYLADVDGQPLRITERDRVLDSLRETLVTAEIDSDQVDQVFSMFAGMSDDMLAQLILRAPTRMSLCQSLSLEEGAPNVYASQMPNPFGSGYGSATVSYQLLSMDDKTAKIEYKFEADPVAAQQFLRDIAAQMTVDDELSQSERQNMSMVRADSAICEVDVATGWVTQMEYRTETTVQSGQKSQSKIETNAIAVRKSSPPINN